VDSKQPLLITHNFGAVALIISPHMAFYSNILYIFAEISISLGKRFCCQYLYYACGISINPA
ncbi:hypothetical protein, partial [Muribaculum intestinale]|uniref:hypothetical protein n=1 Tax=Muribaculum intestinale TaxID=1796646 RepID=UPI0025B6B482